MAAQGIKQKGLDTEARVTLQQTVCVTGNKSLSELRALSLAYEMTKTLPNIIL